MPPDFTTWLNGFRAGIGDRAPTAEVGALVAEKAASVREVEIVPSRPTLPAPVADRPWWERPVTATGPMRRPFISTTVA